MSRTIASIDPKTNGLFKSGFFTAARQPIQTHLQNAINEQDYPLALDAFTNLMRIHLEMEDKANIDELLLQISNYEAFSEYVENESKFHYSMALIAFYFSKTDLAFQKIDLAIQLALTQDNLDDLTSALLGKIRMYVTQKPSDLSEVHRQMDKIEMILSKTNNIEHIVIFHLAEANIALMESKFDLAVEKTWLAYNKSKHVDFPAFFSISAFASLGFTYLAKKDFDKAAIYLQIAKKTLDPASMKRTNRMIENLLTQCPTEDVGYDLLLDMNDKKVKFKSKNEVDLKNQFVLIDMIKVFFEQKEKPISKSDLVEKIWLETYDPSRHDNLIYVTIKRLRNILKERDEDEDIIVRTKKGYSLKPGILAVVR